MTAYVPNDKVTDGSPIPVDSAGVSVDVELLQPTKNASHQGLEEAVSEAHDEYKESGLPLTGTSHIYIEGSPTAEDYKRMDTKLSILGRTHADFSIPGHFTKLSGPKGEEHVQHYESGIPMIDKNEPDYKYRKKVYHLQMERNKTVQDEMDKKTFRSLLYDACIKDDRVGNRHSAHEKLDQWLKTLDLSSNKLDLGKFDERTLRDFLKVEYPLEEEADHDLSEKERKHWAAVRAQFEDDANLVEIIIDQWGALQPKALLGPRLSSFADIKKAMKKNNKHEPGHPTCLCPSYWHKELASGRKEQAQLIKVGIDVTNIWNIDSAEQCVDAHLFVNFTWEVDALKSDIWDPRAKEFIDDKITLIDVKTLEGKIFQNLMKKDYYSNTLSPGSCMGGKTQITQRLQISGTFSQQFSLEKFPFDEQELEFILVDWVQPYRKPLPASKNAKDGNISRYQYPTRGRKLFYEDPLWKCRVKKGALAPSDEWELMRWDWQKPDDTFNRLDIDFGLTDPDPKIHRQWPKIVIKCRLHRRPEFIKWNAALPICMTVVFGLVGNLTALENDFDRTSFTAALLFTIFSIKSNVSYALSKVGYRNRLDNFIIISQFVIILLGMIGVFFSYNLPDAGDVDEVLKYYLMLYPGFCLLAVYLLVFIQFWRGFGLFPLLGFFGPSAAIW